MPRHAERRTRRISATPTITRFTTSSLQFLASSSSPGDSQRARVMSQNTAVSSTAWAQERERQFTDPIEIPAAASASGARADGREAMSRGWEEERGDDGGGEVVPPHVLLARRRAAFSVCSGQGRTLKGRDLRRVRDSVLRMTGFIES
ncbi:hypothetical protein ACP70R_036852 [Stipagrostis hirtigluma subsp. patula]